MEINGIQCDLQYPIKVEHGLALIWREFEGGFWDVRDLGAQYDKIRSSFSICGVDSEIYPLHESIRTSISNNDPISLTAADEERVLGALYPSGAYSLRVETLGNVTRKNFALYEFQIDVICETHPDPELVVADFYQMPVPVSYENSAYLDQQNVEPIYPQTFETLSDGANKGTWPIVSPRMRAELAASVLADVTQNIRRLSFELPASWSGLYPFGQAWQSGTWAYVQALSETVKRLDSHILKMELVKDVS